MIRRKNRSTPLQHKQFAFKADSVADDGTFSGYGSVFGNVDSYREIVAPGAFAESLKAIADSGDPLPALWQHRHDEPIGGYDLLAEDARGLKCSGWLMIQEIPLAAQAHALMKRRVVKGLSIGYYVEASDYNEKTGVRTLTKLDLQEISIVTFPANVEALVDDVKAKLCAGQLPSLKEFEKHLREAGFSKTQATAIASGGLAKLLRSESGDPSQANRTGDRLAALLRS
ncbi:HK97 family phage prohead protease [Dokdonella sp. MW10]|uniref:HK97 family phage prohead protease n=1 Tax=Dokdonella sp. MW10 TaxID=2992926 RepID=UPI003F806C7F